MLLGTPQQLNNFNDLHFCNCVTYLVELADAARKSNVASIVYSREPIYVSHRLDTDAVQVE